METKVQELNFATPERSMPTPRVVIVEDESMVAMDLELTVREIIPAEVIVVPSALRRAASDGCSA